MKRKKRGITLEDLSPKHRAQALAQINAAVPATDSKSSIGHAPLRAKKAKRYHRPYCGTVFIHYACRRKHLADADGDFYKWFTDAFVECGILEDDKAKYVKGISHQASEKAKNGEENMTIEIWAEDCERSESAPRLG